ncbi:MAG: hypothetical protein LBS87_00705 [Puniceicoccales bacterium]|jgi:hypothetical protein|nr:hypothetical protein [Puniceicoccales bacterium]
MKIIGKIGNSGVSGLNRRANKKSIRQKLASVLSDNGNGIEPNCAIGELGMMRVSAMDLSSVDDFISSLL